MKGWFMKQLQRARRAWKSWTVNWGLLLVVLGEFHSNINQAIPAIKLIIPNDYVGTFITFIGVVVAVLRFKTAKDLADK